LYEKRQKHLHGAFIKYVFVKNVDNHPCNMQHATAESIQLIDI